MLTVHGVKLGVDDSAKVAVHLSLVLVGILGATHEGGGHVVCEAAALVIEAVFVDSGLGPLGRALLPRVRRSS